MTKTIVDDGIILKQKTVLSHDGYTVYFDPTINQYCAEKPNEKTLKSDLLSEIWFLTGGWNLNQKKN